MERSKHIERLRVVVVMLALLCLVQVECLGQNKSAAKKSNEPEIFWRKKVLRKELERKQDLGGGFEFRSMAYYMDCSAGCFENPYHIGEFWFSSKMLMRGGNLSDVSISPSKRFAIFADREARKLELFDVIQKGLVDGVNEVLGGDVEQFTWDEVGRLVTVQYYESKPETNINLPQ